MKKTQNTNTSMIFTEVLGTPGIKFLKKFAQTLWNIANREEQTVRLNDKSIILNDDGNSYTDGNIIVVSPFEGGIEKSLIKHPNISERAMALIYGRALMAHEMYHRLRTKMQYMRDIAIFGNKLFLKNGLNPFHGEQLACHSLNIIEDRRIERIAMREFKALEKDFYILNENNAEEIFEDASNLDVFMTTFLSLAKRNAYPEGIQKFPEIIELFDKTLLQHILEGGDSYSNTNAFEATKNFIINSLEFFKNNLPETLDYPDCDYDGVNGNDVAPDESKKQQKSSKPQPPSNSTNNESKEVGSSADSKGDSSDSEDSSDNNSSADSKGDSSDSKDDSDNNSSTDSKGDSSDSKDDSDNNSSADSKGDSSDSKDGSDNNSSADSKGNSSDSKDGSDNNSSADSKGDSSDSKDGSDNNSSTDSKGDSSDSKDFFKDLDNYAQELEEDFNKSIEEFNRLIKEQRKDSILNKNTLGPNFPPINITTANWGENGISSTPQSIVDSAKVLKRETLKQIETKKTTQRNMPRGRLNSRVLPLASRGCCENPFERIVKTKETIAIQVLIDGSGSMSSSRKSRTRLSLALESGAIIEEGLSAELPLKVVMFNDDGYSVCHTVIKNFSDNQTYINRCYNAINNLSPSSCNSDDKSIAVACEELLTRSEDKKFLIVLSDGQPSGTFTEGPDGVSEVVSYYRKRNINIISLMFGDNNEFPDFVKMYKKDCSYCTPDQIPTILPKLIGSLLK